MTRDSRAGVTASGVAAAGRLAMLVAGVSVALRGAVDPDLWGHVKFGLDILHAHRLSYVDPYSFTQDTLWINHEWLSELCFAAAYAIGGVAGLLLLKALILGAAFACLAWTTRGMRPELRGWVLAATVVALAPAAITFRPQLWTILGISLLCAVLAGRLPRLLLPFLLLFWANLHGGWIVGVGITVLWLAGRLLETRSWRAVAPLAAVLALSVAATLVNPYGWRLWTFLAATVRLSRPDITEWRPYWEAFAPAHLVLWPLTVGLFGATLLTSWRRVRWPTLLPAVWLTLNGLTVSRIAPLAAILVAWCMADAFGRDVAAGAEPAASLPPRSTGAVDRRRIVDLVTLAAIAAPLLISQSRCLPLTDTWLPDPVVAAAFGDPAVHGRLLLPFNWGEYAIWHWGPRLKVSIDGRRETVYSQRTIERQIAMFKATPEGLVELNIIRPEYAWVTGSIDSPLGVWLREHGYRIDIQTTRSFAAVRADRPVLAAAPIPAASCFP